MTAAHTRILELRAELDQHNYRYYVLDEPSIGLHQRDNHKLLSTLMRLRDLGNTVIVVEHDEDTMLAADYIVDIGPGAGIHGGNVIYSGDVQGILKCPESITGQYLSGQRFIPVPQTRREGNGKKITIVGAQHEQHVLERHHPEQRPEDQREDAQHALGVDSHAVMPGEHLLEGVERAGADVAVDHAGGGHQQAKG